MPPVILVAVIWIIIAVLPMWLMVKVVSWAGRKRGWGLRQYIVGMILFAPLWFAFIMRYVVRADPDLILRFTLLCFVLAVIYGLGLFGWDQFFKERAARRQRK